MCPIASARRLGYPVSCCEVPHQSGGNYSSWTQAFQGPQGDEERLKEQLLPLSICRIAFFSKLN